MLCALLAYAPMGLANSFVDAEYAAQEGRYRDVVEILTRALNARELNAQGVVVAHANRGIAYSLLNEYSLAAEDLKIAHGLDPSHVLTMNHRGILAEHVDGNLTAAKAWYEKAPAADFPAAHVNLAQLLLGEHPGVPPDVRRARDLLMAAADADYAMAFVPLGNLARDGHAGLAGALTRAFEWYSRGAAAGVIEAHYPLGQCYQFGLGVGPDAAAAAEQYELAAIQGHASAQNALGYLYRGGSGVTEDFTRAVEWYRHAAGQGHNQAGNRLAWLLATCSTSTVWDGKEALALAEKLTGAQTAAGYLDTLAATQARVGRFGDAVSTMKRVIAGLPAGASGRARFQQRLRLYESGKPYQL